MKHDQQDSQYDRPQTSKVGEMSMCPSVRILLNKWQ
jgi:hypothetical protein